MKLKKSGLTIVEMLVVVGIIAILIGLLLPAISMVRRTATEAKQKVQLAAIDAALVGFRNDYGDYPPSDQYSQLADDPATKVDNTSGAQKLTEALLGWDLLGFHPDSGFRADGRNRWAYRDPGGTSYAAGEYILYNTVVEELEKRKGRYLDLETANPVQLGVTGAVRNGLFDLGSFPLAAETFVLSDVFGRLDDVYVPTSSTGNTTVAAATQRIKAGMPILYYRAHSYGKARGEVYNVMDNYAVVEASSHTMPDGSNSNFDNNEFYEFITDWRASTTDLKVPHKPDSYLLISAGWDGRYGTDDDICNFNR